MEVFLAITIWVAIYIQVFRADFKQEDLNKLVPVLAVFFLLFLLLIVIPSSI